MRKSQLSIAVPAAAFVGHALPALSGLSESVAHAFGIATSVASTRAVALTFDDGPHPEGTPLVLDALDRVGHKASFFLVGEQVAKRPQLAREIRDRGHAIGLHCDRHRNLLRLTPKQLRDDIARAMSQISSATELEPNLYRPPYGVFSAAALSEIRRRYFSPLLWTKAGNDWTKTATPRSIAARVTRDLTAGDVLLLHDADYYSASDSHLRTVAALPEVFEQIKRAGLTAVNPTR